MKFRVSSWNVRWFVSADTERSQGKREVIRKWLGLGYLVCLQETNWCRPTAEAWSSLFPNSTALYTAAVLRPHGGHQGGVAILAPCSNRVTSTVVLEEGRTIQVRWVPGDGGSICVVAFLIHPCNRASPAAAFGHAFPCEVTYMCVGISIKIDHQRGHAEANVLTALRTCLLKVGAASLDQVGTSRRGYVMYGAYRPDGCAL